MYEHSDLVHSAFPSEGANQTRLAGDVVQFGPAFTGEALKGRLENIKAEVQDKYNQKSPDITNISLFPRDKLKGN